MFVSLLGNGDEDSQSRKFCQCLFSGINLELVDYVESGNLYSNHYAKDSDVNDCQVECFKAIWAKYISSYWLLSRCPQLAGTDPRLIVT